MRGHCAINVRLVRLKFTLEVKQGGDIRGFLRGSLGDGLQVGAIASKDGCHEAEESFLDLQLKSVEALSSVKLTVSHGVVHLHIITV